MKRISIIIVLITSITAVKAQQTDTTKKTVVVTSAFKPSIRPAAKINFSAASPVGDTTRPTLVYSVPAQNLFFSYQPVPLKPLALSIDTSLLWENDNYIKLGFGNYSTPYAQAGFSFGDGTGSVINIHTKHISQKGNLPFQQYSRSNADVIGIFNSKGNNELRAKVGFETSNQYLYGYQPDTLKFTKDDLKQRFTNFNAMVGLRNKAVNQFGISYDPTLSLNLFGDNHRGSETNLVLNAPLTKTFGKAFGFNIGFTADLNKFKTGKGTTIKNNLYYLVPAVLLKTPNFKLNAGFTPSWDNQTFNLLPNFTVDMKVRDEKFILQGGWIGYYQRNTYRSLAAFNPWIAQPDALLNTRIKEQYAGFKGSGGNHFTYNGRVSILSFSNAALFVNDAIDGKTFLTIYEPEMKSLRLHGEVGYTVQEKFSMLAGATINQYSGMKNNEKAWGLLPLEVTGALRWQILKDFHLKSDLFFWDGPRYRNKQGSDQKLKPAFDLNAGVEFTVLPKLNLWLQFNNLLNNRYERWNQYQVLGFNVIGGVVYNF
ncbi:MAG: TonB-dependent receptor [Segetibacter sp.]|nr:TonB-dependent receptor [Segetibacter sp.]